MLRKAAHIPCLLRIQSTSELCFLLLQNCKTLAAAKKLLTERGVGHYADLAQAVDVDPE